MGSPPPTNVSHIFDLTQISATTSGWFRNGYSEIDEGTGLRIPDQNPGSYILPETSSNLNKNYGVASTFRFNHPGGSYVIYLAASSDALLSNTPRGSFYAMELSNLQFAANGCSLTATLYRSDGKTTTKIATEYAPCASTYTYHAGLLNGALHFWTDRGEFLSWADPHPLNGISGVGGINMPEGNGIASFTILPADEAPPNPVDKSTIYIESSVQVNIIAKPTQDDPSGSGVAKYIWMRDGAYLAKTSRPEIHDADAKPDMYHTYTLQAQDFFGNRSLPTTLKIYLGSTADVPTYLPEVSESKESKTFFNITKPMDDSYSPYTYYFLSDWYYGDGTQWSWYAWLGSQPLIYYGYVPSSYLTYDDATQYDLNQAGDTNGGKTLSSFKDRVQASKWIKFAKTQLQQFNANVTNACQVDMQHLDVSASKIRSLAGDDRSAGGTTISDYRAVIPEIQNKINHNADLTAIANPHTIVINLANMWQTSYSYALGSVLHELVHIAHYSVTDTAIQSELGLAKNTDDTTNTSIRLANDCFAGATAPSN